MSAKLFKRGKIYYIYEYRRGQCIKISTKTSIKDVAEETLRKYLLTKKRVSKKSLFSDVMMEFFLKKERKLKKKTFNDYKVTAKPIAQYFIDRDLYEIKRYDIKDFEESEKLKGKSDGMLLKELSLFKEIYNFANEMEYIDYNPFTNYKFKEEYKSYLPRIRFFSPKEIKLILNEILKQNKKYLYRLVVFILETGIRIGEALSLSYNDVAYDGKTPYITIKKENAKNGKERFIPLTPLALKQITDSRDLNPTYYIFTYNGTPFKTAPKRSFDTILKSVGLKETGMSFHTLRHTAGSLWLSGLNIDGTPRKQLSIETISTILGHSDIRLTKRVYAHFDKSAIINSFLGIESGQKVGKYIPLNP